MVTKPSVKKVAPKKATQRASKKKAIAAASKDKIPPITPSKKKAHYANKADCGKSQHQQIKENKLEALKKATAAWDRNHYLVSFEITPQSLKRKGEESHRIAWVVENGKPVLKRIPIKLPVIKPIVVPIVWASKRKVRKISLYGGEVGQMGTFTLDNLQGEIRQRYLRLWIPNSETGWKGLSPSTFTEWTDNGRWVDKKKEVFFPYNNGRIIREQRRIVGDTRWVNPSPIEVARFTPTKVTSTTTRVARIVIPPSVVYHFINTVGVKNNNGVIRHAIATLEAAKLPILADTIEALCRCVLAKPPAIRMIQLNLQWEGLKPIATAMGKAVYGRKAVTVGDVAWALAYDDSLAETLGIDEAISAYCDSSGVASVYA